MRNVTNRTSQINSVDVTALDWGSIGRLVRQRTLEAVAMHFAAVGQAEHAVASQQGSRQQRVSE